MFARVNSASVRVYVLVYLWRCVYVCVGVCAQIYGTTSKVKLLNEPQLPSETELPGELLFLLDLFLLFPPLSVFV